MSDHPTLSPKSTLVEPAHDRDGHLLGRFTTVLLLAYLAFISGLMLLRRSTISLEVVLAFAGVIAVLLARRRAFVRDWAPLPLIFLAWQLARGLSADIGTRVQSNSVIAVERFISFGTVPSVEAQRAWYTPGHISVFDVAMTLVYLAHFLLPVIVAVVLWLVRRDLYYPYAMALLLVSLGQFATAVLLPVAPPRFASLYGAALPVHDISLEVTRALNLGPLSWAYQNLNGNPLAAFPSLHAAYPVLAFLFLRRRWPRAALLMLTWGAVVIVAIVYLAHHYVVDAIAGIGYALVAYWLVNELLHAAWPQRWPRRRRRRLDNSPSRLS